MRIEQYFLITDYSLWEVILNGDSLVPTRVVDGVLQPELKFILFSVSQMCDKKNGVLFTDTECLALSPDFKLPNESQVLLRVPRENNLYNVNLKNIVPSGDLTCLFAKATIDESNLWHKRLGHINFKTMNKLVKGNLVRGLPKKVFENDNTCVACKKGKQHRASCKTKPVSYVDQPLYRLHMDLFGPTFVKSLNKKSYCLFVIDDYSRFTWVFFLATKDETSLILKTFITGLENQLSLTMKVIRSDNGTKFKNNDLNQLCGMKGIKREFSAEAVNTTYYVQNRVLVTKPHNKTSYELLNGRTLSIGFMRPFGCPVTILNTLDSLGKFDGKVDEGFLVGYSEPAFEGSKLESEVNVFPSSSAQSKKQDDKTKRKAKEDITYFDDEGDVGVEADFNNLETSITVSPIPTIRVHKDHPVTQIIGDLSSATQTRSMSRVAKDQGGLSQIFNDDFHTCMFAWFLLQEKPKRVHQALKDLSWFEAMQEELLQFKMQKEEGINYEKVFAPIARIEAIRLFLAYASFMGFMVYQMDVKSAFLYGTIKEEVYVCQPSGFEDPDHPDKRQDRSYAIYQKVEKGYSAGSDLYGKSASTPIDTEKPLLKDPDGEDVDVHTYRSMIGSLMCLTSSRPDIMFAVVLSGMESLKRMVNVTNILRVSTPRCDEHRLELMELTVFLLPSDENVRVEVNDVIRLQALVDKKKVVVTKATIIEALLLDDAEGVECLPNEEIFAELARMGYEKPSTKLTFYKAFFSSQWSIVRNVDSLSKFYMYPCFLQLIIRKQVGKGFYKVATPLFEGMLVAQEVEEGDANENVENVNAGDTVEGDVSAANDKGRMIAEMDQDVDIVLEEAKEVVDDAKADQDAKEEELEPAELQEVVDIVTTAKLITKVVIAASTTISANEVLVYAATTAVASKLTTALSKRTKGVVVRDLEESTTTTSTIIHTEAKSKDKGKGILVDKGKGILAKEDPAVKRYQALKRKPQTEVQARKNMMIYLKNVAGFKMDYFKGMSYYDIRPIFEAMFNTNVAFLQKTKEHIDEEESRALKRINETPA
uniref:Integrase catalytic domain-containing protein n=1 Tax=Tanacetum cinerariifolium TaxID=118510 RepID=A0A6L2L1N9_TANCI|nr:hypothetical protein [Tanacetum cinerariifolium]